MASDGEYQTLVLHWTTGGEVVEVKEAIDSMMPPGRYKQDYFSVENAGHQALAYSDRWFNPQRSDRPPVFIVTCDEKAARMLASYIERPDAIDLARTVATALQFLGASSSKWTGWKEWFIDSQSAPLVLTALCLLAKSLGGDAMLILRSKQELNLNPVGAKGPDVTRSPTRSGLTIDYLESDSLPLESAKNDRARRARQLLSVILGPWLCRVAPLPGDKKLHQYLAEGRCASKELGDFSVRAEEHFYERLFRQEFGGRKIVNAFLRMCAETIAYGEWTTSGGSSATPLALLPVPAYTALVIARLSRRLATCTLEGVPFRCSVLLTNDDPDKTDGTSGVIPILRLNSPVPFNFQFEDEIRDIAEMAQGEGMFLFVSSGDGALKGIYASGSPPKNPTTRMKDLARLTNIHEGVVGPQPVVFHSREPGHVEIYAQGTLRFWNDGFQWTHDPYGVLRKRLDSHFKDVFTDQKLEDVIDTYVYAIADLQDRRRSSIIILADHRDEESIGQFAGSHLRPRVAACNIGGNSLVSGPSVLSSLLHLDGAHIVYSNGKLAALARGIVPDKSRYAVEIDANAKDELKKAFKRYGLYEDFAIVPVAPDDNKPNAPTNEYNLVVNRYLPLSRLTLWPPDDGLKVILRKLVLEILLKLHFREDVSTPLSRVKLATIQQSENHLSDVEKMIQKNNSEINLDQFGRLVEYEFFADGQQDAPGAQSRANQQAKWLKSAGVEEVIPGESMRFFIPESKIVGCVWEPDPGMSPAAYQALRQWYDYGDHDARQLGPGTGTRAAESLAKKMPYSTIIKVSSSGKIKFFPNRKNDANF